MKSFDPVDSSHIERFYQSFPEPSISDYKVKKIKKLSSHDLQEILEMLKDLEFHKHKVLLKSTISRRWSIATLSKYSVHRAALIPEHTNSKSTMKTNFIFKRILNMIWNMRDNLKECEGIPE
jgi:hypothetical protein